MNDNQINLAELPDELLRKLVSDIQDCPAVDYSPRLGAVCPICGQEKCRVCGTSPWSGSVRERWHRCQRCEMRFKSVEVDNA